MTLRAVFATGIAAVALLALPAAAAAGGGPSGQSHNTELQMWLRSSNGYLIRIENIDRHYVSLDVSPAHQPYVIDGASYSTRGTVTDHGLKADFGPFGHISVQFHGHPVAQREGARHSRHCGRRQSVHEIGRFEGTIRFNGEQGFATVSARKAKGSLRREFARPCPHRPRHAKARLPRLRGSPERFFATTLAAGAKTSRRAISVELRDEKPLPNSPGIPLATILITITEHRSGVWIQRTLFVDFEGGPESFHASSLDATPITAIATLPAPFAGIGTYSKETGSPASWTGDLSAELPGAGTVSLSGPDFTALLCRGKEGEAEFDDCEFEAEPLSNAPFELPYWKPLLG
jgi:hypothetical protein